MDALKVTTAAIFTGGALYILYRLDVLQPLPPTKSRAEIRAARLRREAAQQQEEEKAEDNLEELAELPLRKAEALPSDDGNEDKPAWSIFADKFESLTSIKDIEWEDIQEGLKDFLLPEWAKELPESMEKLQRELSMAPGSLADEIWKDALDPEDNPEVATKARVRISEDLCDEEKEYLQLRRKFTTAALAKYLGIPEEEIHPDDVPVIAMCSSGGGLRALVAGTGSMAAAHEDGLFDCITYTAGVSGSCWMQALYHSSLGKRDFNRMVDHLKARLGTHIAYPPVALSALNSAPTNKFLLSGFVEKLKGDPNADFGIVDVYGLLLAARLLVPKGELSVDNRDLKISNQRNNLTHGKYPMPIYTAVRHEIPILEEASEEEKKDDKPSEESKEKAAQESWFQWFEITPYEFFCEEFSAGIPTWAMGRKFHGGADQPISKDTDLRVPELKLPLLLGVFGSAMCATLSHYAREVRPVIQSILPSTGFSTIQEMIEDRSDDLSKVHPIDPASIPNPYLGLEGRLPATAPESIFAASHLQLMDAGMSNNLPIFPVLRPGRDVDIVVAFDASADIKTENWLAVTEGYAKQRGIKGWPIGAGWPKNSDTVAQTTAQLDKAETASLEEAEEKVQEAKTEQKEELEAEGIQASAAAAEAAGAAAALPEHEATQEDELIHGAPPTKDLGHCSVWVGTTAERTHEDSTTEPPSKTDPFIAEDWELMEPDAGIAVVYFPFIANEKVEGVDPQTSPFMSTWNFVYTEEDVEKTVQLAKQNFQEGRDQTRRVVRAVYERKKRLREERERKERYGVFKRKLRLGVLGKKEGDSGQGDQFR